MTTFSIGGYKLEIDLTELIFPFVVLAFCAVYYVDTRGIPDQSLLYAEPVLYATVLLALAVVAVFGVRVNSDETQRSQSASSMSGFTGDQWRSRKALLLLLLTAAHLVGIRLQFVLATLLFLGGTLYVLGERTPRILIAYSTTLTAIIYAVFVLWLGMPL